MSNRLRTVATGVCCAIAVASFVSLFTTDREAYAQSIMPQRAKVVVGEPLTVIMKNPEGIDNGGNSIFTFDSTCLISAKSEYVALAQHDGRVLVELNFNLDAHLLGSGKGCPTGTLFWRSEQQFRMAAQEYRRHAALMTVQDEERELIRNLLPRRTAEKR